jgi:hypothetical protein
MRDKRFVAEHRGGPLKKEQHRQLIRWARKCSENVLPLLDEKLDERLIHALHVAKEWENGNVPVGDAMKASLSAHAAAREANNPIAVAVARSVGQAVATAHMADHSMGAALYALKAVKAAGKSIDKEKEFQIKKLQQLPTEIVELIVTTMMIKGKSFKLY